MLDHKEEKVRGKETNLEIYIYIMIIIQHYITFCTTFPFFIVLYLSCYPALYSFLTVFFISWYFYIWYTLYTLYFVLLTCAFLLMCLHYGTEMLETWISLGINKVTIYLSIYLL